MLRKTQTLYYFCEYLQSIILDRDEFTLEQRYTDLIDHVFNEYLSEFKISDNTIEIKEFENELTTIEEISDIGINNDSEANLNEKYQRLVVRMNKLLYLMKNITRSWNHNFKFLINKFI